jgi:hypothetical protein
MGRPQLEMTGCAGRGVGSAIMDSCSNPLLAGQGGGLAEGSFHIWDPEWGHLTMARKVQFGLCADRVPEGSTQLSVGRGLCRRSTASS